MSEEIKKRKRRDKRRGPLTGLKHLLETALVLCLTLPIALLPYGISVWAGRGVGLMLYHALGRRRRIALNNVQGAMDRGCLGGVASAEEVVKEHFQLLGRWAVEAVRVLYGKDEDRLRNMPVENRETFEEILKRGKGIVGVTAHFCNWELLGLAASVTLAPLHSVAREQSNPYLDWFINRVRVKYGSKIIFKEGALRELLTLLKQGGMTGVLFDQASSPHQGLLADFLGAPAWTMRTPVALGKRTGAAVLPIYLRPDPGGYYRIVVHPEVPLTEDEVADTRKLLSVLEEEIRLHPAYWLWIHRRWKNAPPAQARTI